MEKSKKDSDPIDEKYLISIMAGGVRKEGLLPKEDTPAAKEQAKAQANARPKYKKPNEEDYEKLFFRNTEGNARYGKTAYIRPEFHERISRIIQVIGEDKISFYSNLDNVLDFHFREFGEQIKRSFDDKYKPIL